MVAAADDAESAQVRLTWCPRCGCSVPVVEPCGQCGGLSSRRQPSHSPSRLEPTRVKIPSGIRELTDWGACDNDDGNATQSAVHLRWGRPGDRRVTRVHGHESALGVRPGICRQPSAGGRGAVGLDP